MAGDVFNPMARVVWQAGSLVALVLGLVVCGGVSSLRGPTPIEHPRDSYVEVPFPPPAALAETVPAQPPGSELVWLDGDWSFRGKAYAWRRGGWFAAPAGARYASSKILYLTDGRLLFAPAAWYDASGQILPRVRPVRPALTPPNEVTSELQVGR